MGMHALLIQFRSLAYSKGSFSLCNTLHPRLLQHRPFITHGAGLTPPHALQALSLILCSQSVLKPFTAVGPKIANNVSRLVALRLQGTSSWNGL